MQLTTAYLCRVWAKALEALSETTSHSGHGVAWSRLSSGVLRISAEGCCFIYQVGDWWLMGGAAGRGIFVALMTPISENRVSYQPTPQQITAPLSITGQIGVWRSFLTRGNSLWQRAELSGLELGACVAGAPLPPRRAHQAEMASSHTATTTRHGIRGRNYKYFLLAAQPT